MGLYAVSENTLTSIADAIRNKTGKSSRLTFPSEFISEINGIVTAPEYNIYFDTTANWSLNTSYVPAANEIIVYTDRSSIDNKNVPGIKIGDGNAYCVDLPFITDDLAQNLLNHIEDNIRHITDQERQFWNNKLNLQVNGEELQFNRS